jgi:hypothetical protein
LLRQNEAADRTGSPFREISHAGHSNVRHSPPLWFGEIRASHISDPHRRHCGRLIVVVFVGFNRVSGMGPFCKTESYVRHLAAERCNYLGLKRATAIIKGHSAAEFISI